MGTIVGFLGEAKHLEAVMRFFGRHAYGRLACLAVLAVIALVACGAGPGATKTQDPVGFKNIDLRQGSTSEISLVNTFSGSELTYSATSSDPSKVKVVAVDNDKDTLTVEAVSPGTATITVTAKNPQGSHDQTFTVTVPEPKPEDDGTGGEEEGAPTVRAGATDSVDVDQGDTETVTLSRVFTGEDLEFSASSSDTDVATVSISDAGILTVRARSPGDATITVTATNAGGRSAIHEIAVTVPEPATTTPEPPMTNNPSNCPSPLTIKLNEVKKCKLPPKATLQAPPAPADDVGAGVEARPSADVDETDVWIIAARRKGTYTVTIFSGAASPVKIGEITVIVPNSRPTRNTTPAPAAKIVPTDSNNTYTATINPNLGTYFTDADTDSLRYSIGKKPGSILIDAKDGFVVTNDEAGQLTFEVLEEVSKDFQVAIYANDDSGAKSQLPVVLTLGPADGSSLTPRIVSTYSVTQKATGELSEKGTLKVGPRLGVGHTVTFNAPSDKGFVFAESAYDRLAAADKLPNDSDGVGTTVHFKRQDGTYNPTLPDETGDDGASNREEGDDYFIIESTGAVVLVGSADSDVAAITDGGPTVEFQLKKGSSSGSIIIKYRVWALSSSTSTSTSKNPYQKSLSVSVVTCNSPPDDLDDCP